ncbi:hypothetical protein F2Q69_00050409 [Brassica cretica]|uniref:Uncharacterized protein n=1 Tax=Brassica cretica TaxID=69181 RepID=A0A8S9PVL9_BRACR|nr:hypothetical protein F2Q69_00050409 [Brassica cretica]
MNRSFITEFAFGSISFRTVHDLVSDVVSVISDIPHVDSVGTPAPNSNRIPFSSTSAGRLSGKAEGLCV